MSKRKQLDMDADEDADDATPELVDVHFDFYNVNASNDYHAINRLLIQLFGANAERVQTGPLTEVVVRVAEESGVGSTIKIEEDEASDPYAVLTVISCRERGLERAIEYVLSESDAAFRATLTALLRDRHVGLVLSERLVNMPVQVMAPMYTMLADELDAAECGFTDYLFVSRAYRLTEDEPSSKRPKKSADGVLGFHPEDDEIMEHASHAVTFAFAERDPESVGLDVAARAMVVPAEKFRPMVDAIRATYGS